MGVLRDRMLRELQLRGPRKADPIATVVPRKLPGVQLFSVRHRGSPQADFPAHPALGREVRLHPPARRLPSSRRIPLSAHRVQADVRTGGRDLGAGRRQAVGP